MSHNLFGRIMPCFYFNFKLKTSGLLPKKSAWLCFSKILDVRFFTVTVSYRNRTKCGLPKVRICQKHNFPDFSVGLQHARGGCRLRVGVRARLVSAWPCAQRVHRRQRKAQPNGGRVRARVRAVSRRIFPGKFSEKKPEIFSIFRRTTAPSGANAVRTGGKRCDAEQDRPRSATSSGTAHAGEQACTCDYQSIRLTRMIINLLGWHVRLSILGWHVRLSNPNRGSD